MNIFALYEDPAKCAEVMTDQHVVKMILESAQMLSTTYWISHALGYTPRALTQSERSQLTEYVRKYHGTVPYYKATHINHPSSIWVRSSLDNFFWLKNHIEALNDEWRFRFNHTVNHRSFDVVCDMEPYDLADKGLMPFKPAMPLDYIEADDPVQSYRNYYMAEKVDGKRFTKRKAPKFKTTKP